MEKKQKKLKKQEKKKKENIYNLIDDYISGAEWRVKENANMDFSLNGMRNHIYGSVTAKYWLNKVYSKEIGEAHENAAFHIHDLSELSSYCVGWDLKDLLLTGFGGVLSKIESKPAKHFRTALGHIVNFLYTVQGEVAGAVALANFDTYLAPFIYYDKLSYKEIKQAMQEFLYNMNVPTRVGFQTPFTNLTMDLTPPSSVAKEPIIIGGEIKDKTYGEFQDEMDLINKAFAEVMVEGDAKGRVFTFPIPTYNITKNFDWSNKVLEPVWKMTSKYGIPYFANFINSDMDPDDARSMCCRLRLDNRELRKRGGGLFGANPLTGSIGVVTLNLPQAAYLSENYEDFIKRIDKLADLAKESLEVKRKKIEELTETGLFPYCAHYLRSVKKRFGKYWQNHFSTIGIIGMNEAGLNLFGKGLTTEEGQKFGKKVLDHLREKILIYQKETDNFYNLEASPAEGASYRLAKTDKKKYSDIIVANNENCKKGDEPYYTNSSQLPVGFTNDVFEALDLQDDLQTKYTGGTVLHCFLGEQMPSFEATKNLVRKIAENYSLSYYTITPTFSICPKHGYIPGEHEYCPKCDEEMGFYSIKKVVVKQNRK